MSNDDSVRLFRASTVKPEYRGYKNVVFHWFMLNRAQPVAPYEMLIADHQALDRLAQLHLENVADEAFTEQEIAALGSYFKAHHHTELAVKALALPLQVEGSVNPNAFTALSSQALYMLSPEEGASLPFAVYGRFDLSRHDPIDEDEKEAQRLGVLYLQESLKTLGLAAEQDFAAVDGKCSEAKLIEVVLKLREEGLQVSSSNLTE